MRKLWKGVGAGLAVTFVAGFGWFSYIENWVMAMWCLGAAMIAMGVALALSKMEDSRY